MQMDTAYCMIKSQLHMPSIVRVALCSVCWGDYILSCIFMCLCVDIQEIDEECSQLRSRGEYFH